MDTLGQTFFIIILASHVALIASQLESRAVNPDGGETSEPRTQAWFENIVVCIVVIVVELILTALLLTLILRSRLEVSPPIDVTPKEQEKIEKGYEKQHQSPDVKWFGP